MRIILPTDLPPIDEPQRSDDPRDAVVIFEDGKSPVVLRDVAVTSTGLVGWEI